LITSAKRLLQHNPPESGHKCRHRFMSAEGQFRHVLAAQNLRIPLALLRLGERLGEFSGAIDEKLCYWVDVAVLQRDDADGSGPN
jgi:hypothetical protein